MHINEADKKKIIHILTDIFPGVQIYYYGDNAKAHDADRKKPEMDIALDVGRKIGDKDIGEAQKVLAESHIPYTIYLYDLNGVSEHERKAIIARAQAWKLGF